MITSPRVGMGPRCTCVWGGLRNRIVADPECPAREKHSDELPKRNPVDRALPPQGYYEYAPSRMVHSTMEFRGGTMRP